MLDSRAGFLLTGLDPKKNTKRAFCQWQGKERRKNKAFIGIKNAFKMKGVKA